MNELYNNILNHLWDYKIQYQEEIKKIKVILSRENRYKYVKDPHTTICYLGNKEPNKE